MGVGAGHVLCDGCGHRHLAEARDATRSKNLLNKILTGGERTCASYLPAKNQPSAVSGLTRRAHRHTINFDNEASENAHAAGDRNRGRLGLLYM